MPKRIVCLLVVGGVLAQLGACKPATRPEGDADAGTQMAATAYWLVNTDLTTRPEGGDTFHVQGPTPVALFRDRRVRSKPGAAIQFDGYIPEECVRHPKRDGGLMLYVHRTADLHIESPEGPIIGRLHPGAFVSVGETRADSVAIGGLGFENVSPRPAYVRRDALGFEVVPLAPAPRVGKGRTKVVPLAFSFEAPQKGKRIVIEASECYETWFPAEGHPSQIIRGVEITGASDTRDRGTDQPRSYLSTAYCSTRAISKHGSRLFLAEAQPGQDVEVHEVPTDFLPVDVLSPDPLLHALHTSGSVYWLVSDSSTPSCLECSFERATRRTTIRAEPDLGHLRCGAAGASRPAWSYSVAYQRSFGKDPARLHLVQLPPLATSQIASFDYTLLGKEGDALLVTPYRVPERMVAFHPAQAERWYLERASCESSLARIVEHLSKSPERSTAVGFHISE